MHNAKLFWNTGHQPTPTNNNGILKTATNAVSLKYLSSFWRSLEMSLINCKVELKRRWLRHCFSSVLGNENDNINPDSNNITFTIKDIKLYVPAITLSAKDNQKLSKILSIGFETLMYWNEYNSKSENKNTTNKYRCFLESTHCRG